MENIFKTITRLIIIGLLISGLLHIVLYSSDSPEYRQWVTVQIAIQIMGASALYYVLRYNTFALLTFSILSISFAVINALYINYNNYIWHIAVLVVFWLLYGSVIFNVRNKFKLRPHDSSNHYA